MRTEIRGLVCSSLLLMTLAACSLRDDASEFSRWVDPSPHESGYVVANGVRLNYLDWGGSGDDLVLVHGLGDSPHIFDDLAPPLSDRFRVVAYARRSHGSSDAASPLDNGTLVEDLRQLLDSLGIDRAGFLGWSMGGNEITEFARLYPDRVTGLVYLDAAYDWSDPRLIQAFDSVPVAFAPDSLALRSLDDLRSWFQKTWLPELPWPTAWEAHLRDLVREGADGSLEYRIPDSVTVALFESLVSYQKDYTQLRVPALAFYAPVFFPISPTDTARTRKLVEWERRFFEPYREASIERFRREVAHATVINIPNTTHASIGAADVHGLAADIVDFLDGIGGG